jgi:hypothetical protein
MDVTVGVGVALFPVLLPLLFEFEEEPPQPTKAKDTQRHRRPKNPR